MRVVIDTNVVISGTFFGGKPREILEAAVDGRIVAFATPEIVDEYQEVIDEMISRKQGHLRRDVLAPFEAALSFIRPQSKVEVCRDPDDDKFLGCAIEVESRDHPNALSAFSYPQLAERLQPGRGDRT